MQQQQYKVTISNRTSSILGLPAPFNLTLAHNTTRTVVLTDQDVLAARGSKDIAKLKLLGFLGIQYGDEQTPARVAAPTAPAAATSVPKPVVAAPPLVTPVVESKPVPVVVPTAPLPAPAASVAPVPTPAMEVAPNAPVTAADESVTDLETMTEEPATESATDEPKKATRTKKFR